MTFKLTNFLRLPEKQEIPDIPDLINDVITKSRDILPPQSFSVADDYLSELDKVLHQISCQAEIEAKKGQALQCARGKVEAERQRLLQLKREKDRLYRLKESERLVKFNNKNRGLTRSNLGKVVLNQNTYKANYRETNTQLSIDKSDFAKNFDPSNVNSTLGNRAILFDANGRVLRTANEIRRDGAAIDASASLASGKKARAQAAKLRPRTEIKSLSNALDKMKGTGEITGLASLFAAITGMIAVIALFAILIPSSFITVALNWLQTITTMFANINNVVTTYLSFTEAGLSLFGYKNSTKGIKDYVNSIAWGLFGKENYEEAKAAFAKGILNLTSLTKMLEKIEAFRNGSNSRIDAVIGSLGVTNGALKEAGLIEPGSDLAQASEAIDKAVDAQAKVSTDPDFKENIQKLTSEIQTQDEIEKEIKEETEAREKVQKQKQKELDNLTKLGEDFKPLVDKQIADASE